MTMEREPTKEDVYRCDWCDRIFVSIAPLKGGTMNQKVFCCYFCHKNDYEYHNDNCFSDADNGL